MIKVNIRIREMKSVIKVLSKRARERTGSAITQNVRVSPNNCSVIC